MPCRIFMEEGRSILCVGLAGFVGLRYSKARCNCLSPRKAFCRLFCDLVQDGVAHTLTGVRADVVDPARAKKT